MNWVKRLRLTTLATRLCYQHSILISFLHSHRQRRATLLFLNPSVLWTPCTTIAFIRIPPFTKQHLPLTVGSYSYFPQTTSMELQDRGQHLVPTPNHRPTNVRQQLSARTYDSSSDKRDMCRLGRKQDLQVHFNSDMADSQPVR